jgi:hypothetical protein
MIVGHNPGLEELIARWSDLHIATRGVLSGLWQPERMALKRSRCAGTSLSVLRERGVSGLNRRRIRTL